MKMQPLVSRTYDPATGRLTEIDSGPSGAVQNQSYAYDPLGNLTGRSDANSRQEVSRATS